MVRDHPVVHLAAPVRITIGDMGRSLDQPAHQVGVIIVVLALQQCADPFQAHSGVDRLPGQIDQFAGLQLLVLHEHQIPDLDEPVAVLVGAARRAAPDVIAMVEKDLGARTAGTGRTHAPEIVVGGNADDPVIGQARNLLPDRRSLVIGVIDRDQQLVLRDVEILGQQFPGERDRLGFEIVAEAEISQHFKEGMVACGIADIVQIVVLSACAHAFLRRGGAAVVAVFQAGEHVLELDHAGIGEHQRRIIARHQGRAVDDGVALAAEIVEEGRTDVV